MPEFLDLLQGKLPDEYLMQHRWGVGRSYLVSSALQGRECPYEYAYLPVDACWGKEDCLLLEVALYENGQVVLHLSYQNEWLHLVFMGPSLRRVLSSFRVGLVGKKQVYTPVTLEKALMCWKTHAMPPKMMTDFLLYLFDLDATVVLA